MTLYDKAVLGKQAKELFVARDTFEKVLRLSEILSFFSHNELLKSALALKGGTAINLIFFNLPRLSVDIDLDFCLNLSKQEMLYTRDKIQEILLKYMNSNGYSLSLKSKTYHSLCSYVFEYTNAGGMKDNIKIEINYSLRAHVLQTQTNKISSEIIKADFNVNTLSPIEIYAGKTVALLTRGAARDLYDMNYMVSRNLFTSDDIAIYHRCVVFYLAIATDTTLAELNFNAIDNITKHKILIDLKPVIRDRDSFDLDVAKTTVKNFLCKNLCLTKNDLFFLNNFKQKQYNPEILFNGDELERIKNHPMALWKVQK